MTADEKQERTRLQVDLRQAICALAEALSLVGIDEHQHGERVACIAVHIAHQLKWDERAISDLFLAGLLHDCGVSSSRVHKSLISTMDWEGAVLHCVLGEYYLSQFRPLRHLAPVIRHHHTHWQELGSQRLPEATALAANLIYLADRVDALRAQHLSDGITAPRSLASAIMETLRCHSPSHFAPVLVDAFAQAAESDGLWYTLEPLELNDYIHEMEQMGGALLSEYDDIYQLAQIFARIVDAKSDFTYNHSVGVANLARHLAQLAGLSASRSDLIEIAALLHDLGKLGVPDELLEKPAALTREEIAVMQRHSYETFRILHRIKGFEEIAEWAGNHHETLLGNGYPFHHSNSELTLEARIIAVADIFQALIQDRPYRKGMNAEASLQQLQRMSHEGKVDSGVVALLGKHLDSSCYHAQAAADDWPLLHLT